MKSSQSRRSFLATAALGAGALALQNPLTATAQTPPKSKIKLGVSTYSYWHFRTEKVTVDTVIDKAAALGVQGVDILHRQMDIPEREPLDAAGRAY